MQNIKRKVSSPLIDWLRPTEIEDSAIPLVKYEEWSQMLMSLIKELRQVNNFGGETSTFL